MPRATGVWLAAGWIAAGAQAQTSFQGVGVLAGGAYSAGYAVSGDAQVVVGESGPINIADFACFLNKFAAGCT